MVRKETKKYENIKVYLNILVNTNMKKVLILQHIDIETPGIITEILKNKNIETDCQKLSVLKTVPRTLGSCRKTLDIVCRKTLIYSSSNYLLVSLAINRTVQLA